MANNVEGDDFADENVAYKVPTKKTLDEIAQMDEEDESLKRYKAALLGTLTAHADVPFPDNPKSVVVTRFTISVEGQPDRVISLLGVSGKVNEKPIVIPEGANYSIKVEYYVQRDIVTGLQYQQSIHRGPIPVDRSSMMLGSYGPQKEPRVWTSEIFEAPKGRLQCGSYSIKSRFIDIDQAEYVSWKWSISVVKSSKSPD